MWMCDSHREPVEVSLYVDDAASSLTHLVCEELTEGAMLETTV